MQVFHGTNIIIEQPKIINRFKTLDFGEGFYTTENEDQARNFAIKICERRSPTLYPIVNCYEFIEDFNNFSVLKFDVPDEKWLDFVVERRRGIALKKRYDLIIGPVANDDVFGTIILYESGQLDKESVIKRFKIKKLYNQVVFCNELILSHLTFIKSYKWKFKVKDRNQISTLLGVCIIPRIIAEIKEVYDNQEEVAIKEFYKSNLFDKLQNPTTGLWHLSAKTLSQMFLAEIKEQIIEFPEEQS